MHPLTFMHSFICSDEIDSYLISYTKSCIQKEYQRLLGPTATIPTIPEITYEAYITPPDTYYTDSATLSTGSGEEEALVPIGTTGARVLEILTMIIQRLEAEVKTRDNRNIQILARLVHSIDDEVGFLLYCVGVYMHGYYAHTAAYRLISSLILPCMHYNLLYPMYTHVYTGA